MTFSPLRYLTISDAQALDSAAERFCERHGISLHLGFSVEERPYLALDLYLFFHHDKALKRLWQACFCRALKVKPAANVCLAHGYVGHTVKG
jgi:hypothetical protein